MIKSCYRRLENFVFAPTSDLWLAVLRTGLGLQVTLYALSLRHDWNNLFRGNGNGLISRDLSEAILNSHSQLIPRIGWLVTLSGKFGLSEDAALFLTWLLLLCAGCFLVFGLFSRVSAVLAWFLHLCAVKSGTLLTYGMDNFTTIGLFYLMLAPLSDRHALDNLLWKKRVLDPSLLGFFRRALQVHLCFIYFSGGLSKSLGAGWWDGSSLWRALTCPPYNVIGPNLLLNFTWALLPLGIGVCLLETGYPVFVWLNWTRRPWLIAILGMHVAIALTMGLYLFSLIMIILNVAAFGPGILWGREKASHTKAILGERDILRA